MNLYQVAKFELTHIFEPDEKRCIFSISETEGKIIAFFFTQPNL